MSFYVVVSEDHFGGGVERVKVFLTFDRAEKYLEENLGDVHNLEGIIIKCKLTSPSNNLFVVVSQDHFGGGQERVKIFLTHDGAEKYLEQTLGGQNLAGQIISVNVRK